MRKVSGNFSVQHYAPFHHMEEIVSWNVLAQKKSVIMSMVAKKVQVKSNMQNMIYSLSRCVLLGAFIRTEMSLQKRPIVNYSSL